MKYLVSINDGPRVLAESVVSAASIEEAIRAVARTAPRSGSEDFSFVEVCDDRTGELVATDYIDITTR